MRWKRFLLIAAWILMVTISAPPSKVEGQGLVEKKKLRILMVAGLGMGQKLEGYYIIPHLSPISEPPLDGVAFSLTVSGPSAASGNGTCAETVQVAVDALQVINTLNVQMGEGNESLLINGEKVPLSNTCLMDEKGVVVAVAAPFAPGIAQQQSSDPAFDAEFGIQPIRRFLGYSIVNPDFSTAAAASVSGSDYSLIITRNAEF
jgi:hypothetical protein